MREQTINSRVQRRLSLSEAAMGTLGRMSRSPVEFGARLVLLDCPGFGDIRLNKLTNRFGSARAILSAAPYEVNSITGIGQSLGDTLASHRPDRFNSDRYWSDLENVCTRGATLVMIGDALYPGSLTTLSVSPPILWIQGDGQVCNEKMVSVVGTRKATPGGRKIAYDLGYALAVEGYTVVSGLAYGIDAEAHRGALDAGGRTAAVLGSGLLRVYPYSHRRLCDRILESGAIISEFPLHTGAKPGHFPRRNRIISGLSVATVIVEAFEKGGALITARLALDQNREVFAFPGDASNPASRGTNLLIRSGEAAMVLGVNEVVQEVNAVVGRTSTEPPTADREPVNRSSRIHAKPDGSRAAQTILNVLSTKAVHVNDLSVSEDAALSLLRLENAGLVRRLPGGYYTSAGQKGKSIK